MKNLVKQRKDQKRNQILSLIRHSRQPLSRFDIKKSTQYSMTTVSNTMNELVQQGLIFEDTCSENNRMGRKPIFLHLNPNYGYFIGIEFNIQYMHSVILNFNGELIYTDFCETKSSTTTDQFLEQLKKQLSGCFAYLNEKQDKVLGIGLGLPGYIDMDNGIALHYTYIKDWINVPIVDILEKEFRVPCYIGNNISSMCLAFKWLNEYRQNSDFVFVSARTGVRSILFINGEPYLGKNCSSGELGHVKIDGCSKQCYCGQRGCLNTEVSTLAIQEKLIAGINEGHFQHIYLLADHDISNITTDLLVQAALDNDPEAIALVTETATYLGYALATVVNLIAPPNLIIANTLCKTGKIFFTPLIDSMAQLTVFENIKNVNITSSPYGENIGAIGAATLVLEKKYNTISHEF